MKKIILILFLLVGISFCQAVSESFSNFYHDTTDSKLIVCYRLDGIDNTNDYGPNGYDLTANNGAGDSVVLGTNPLYSGGNGVYLDSTTAQTFSVDNAAISKLNDLTYVMIVEGFDNGATIGQWYVSGGGSRITFRNSAGTTYFDYYDGAVRGKTTGSDPWYDNTHHVWVGIKASGTYHDTGKSLAIWMDGIYRAGQSTDSLDILYNLTDVLWINDRHYEDPADALWYEVMIFDTVLTSAEIQEIGYLANGWYSKLGQVTRDDWAFHQGFYDGDTVYYPIANTNASWSLTLDAKGTKSGDVLTAWIGGGTAVTQTLTATSVTYTLDLGTVTLSGDSLWFSASASDTVYIDNVTVTDVSMGYENKYDKIPDYWRFKRY